MKTIKSLKELKQVAIRKLNEEFFIDCDREPCCPEGFSGHGVMKIIEHKKIGRIKFDPSKFVLHITEGQKVLSEEGVKIRRAIKNKKILNANVLDQLIISPNMIPKEWKKDKSEDGYIRPISFFGTIYADIDGTLSIRVLCWDGQRWYSDFRWLEDYWGKDDPIAMLPE